jgi:hypothetical protein
MKKTLEIKAPNPFTVDEEYVNIFLAGSIELGLADEWQDRVVKALSDKPIRFLNPRRDAWDSSWAQTKDNPKFVEQVEWELSALESSHVIIMVIDPKTLSPITLLELGLHAKEQKLVVLCPEGFWRKGNVDVVCEYYGINQVNTFEELIEFIRTTI